MYNDANNCNSAYEIGGIYMKRYIRASISESTPSWLKKSLQLRYGARLKNNMLQKYNIALDKANYTDIPTSSSDIPIYYLQTDYGKVVYMPGANDEDSASINGRYRKLGSIAKSKLPQMAEAIVYLDPTDPSNTFDKRDRYQDPRYTYRSNDHGDYAGQYRKTRYDRETNKYEDAGWSSSGFRPRDERTARDKSGYKIPSPESRLEDFYTKYPERLTDKLDDLYQELNDTKQLLFDADFNKPFGNGYSTTYSNCMSRFSDAVYNYRSLLTELKDDDRLSDYSISRYTWLISHIRHELNECKDDLANI